MVGILKRGEQINLNLGCGIIYKPGCINIDKFDNTLTDLKAPAENLPFNSNSIDKIEAFHLIEHFDYIHSKYVLSEWFRVLKPSGILILETPDLNKSYAKFKTMKEEKQKRRLQWLYGIDSPGMQHKTAFTFEILKDILEEVGFEKISKKEAQTHKYEPGLRVECRKPEDAEKSQFFSTFRRELIKKLKIDDSDKLISLEDYCLNEIRRIYLEEFDKNKFEAFKKIITKSAISNPLISLVFYDVCMKFGLIDRKEKNYEKTLNLINYLVKIEFHKKLFTLWSKTKKEPEFADKNFLDFIKRTESLILGLMESEIDYKERLKYIESLKSADIEIFNFHVVQLNARILFNLGVKQFCKDEKKLAKESFLKSLRLNPKNPLVYWNLARLGIAEGNLEGGLENYRKALMLEKDGMIQGFIKRELKLACEGRVDSMQGVPVSEYSFALRTHQSKFSGEKS